MVDGGILFLAIEDFLPVAFSAVGLWVLAGVSGQIDRRSGRLVSTGALLIVLGGFTKPVYKLLLAFSAAQPGILWLDDALFWMLAPGFLVTAAGVRRAGRVDLARPVGHGRWGVVSSAVVVASAAGAGLAGSQAWFFLLLSAATTGNLLAIVALVSWSRSRDDAVAAVLFAGNLVLVLVLAGAAAVLEQTFANQLGEQSVSTAAQAMFMWASIRLASSVRDATRFVERSPGATPAASS